MGLSTIPAVAGVQNNIVAFTSSQTWTVPSSAQFVDVLIVGGGSGSRGGRRNSTNADEVGGGGGILVLRNLYLGGTGTVSVVVGAGSNGTAGTSTTTQGSTPSNAGFSGFGTYGYAGGGTSGVPGYPGIKTAGTRPSAYEPSNVSTPLSSVDNGQETLVNTSRAHNTFIGFESYGLQGGHGGMVGVGSGSLSNITGVGPGQGVASGQASRFTWTFQSLNAFNVNSYIGTGTAGTNGTGGNFGGAAGILGIAGGGGTPNFGGSGLTSGQGGPGAGGGGGFANSAIGGTGGNAGANTGAAGGCGGNSGSTGSGTGGTGGNGASGIVIVKWIG